jgi:hypothetical protein
MACRGTALLYFYGIYYNQQKYTVETKCYSDEWKNTVNSVNVRGGYIYVISHVSYINKNTRREELILKEK